VVFRERARNSLRKRAHLKLEGRVRGDAAVVGGTERARGGGQAAARQRSGRGLEGQVRTDAAVVGGTERARSGGQAAARQQSGRGLEGQVQLDAAVVGGTERARSGGQAAPITSRSVSMTFISAHPPPRLPPVTGLFSYITWTSKWKAVDSRRSNDVMHMVEFADLTTQYPA